MISDMSVPLARQMIGSVLRHHRTAAGYSLDDIAELLECDRSKISRIETGQRGIRVKELRELLAEYAVPEPEQDILLAIAGADRQHRWWRAYADVLPGPARDYILMESVATEVLVYEPQRVPDLLQNADYATASLRADPAGPDEDAGKRLVEVLLTRQESFRERIALGERMLRLEVVIGEAALHQTVGGPDVMRAQLRELAVLADFPGPVSVQVLPFTGGAPAANAPFSILRYGMPGLGVVCQPGITGGVFLTGDADRQAYLRGFEMIRARALSIEDSRRVIEQARNR